MSQQYRGSVKSLNCGVVTILNYGKDVPPKVSHVTMAHDIGHNIGSQVYAMLHISTCHSLIVFHQVSYTYG